ncbi:MAG: sigma-70 family RNA polymerase sigma factor [Candidatus Colwellbacteria bacterium]|nr:sigma-70 family RNA polymerase sigma factor [Candidatus Colwellbacteria bacterium]
MLEDEQELVKRAKGGEAEAFGLLYDYYLPKIYRFVLLKVSHREEAEDLTHQTFLKAWQNIDQYDFRGHSFGSWLYRIARNAVIDYHRKGRISPAFSLDDFELELPGQERSPEELLESRLETETILEAIRELKEIEQEVLLMRFVEELNTKEVAEIVKKTEGAVKLIQHRALKSLAKLLDEKNNGGNKTN